MFRHVFRSEMQFGLLETTVGLQEMASQMLPDKCLR